MDYLSLSIGIIVGLILNKFLPTYFSKKGENLATKEDIGKITNEIEEVKNIYKSNYDLSRTERDFYNEIIKELQEFLAIMKEYEFNAGSAKSYINNDLIMIDPSLKEKNIEFKNRANEILAKSFVFLKEENYKLIKDAFDKQENFAEMRYYLLDAMRQSIHKDTKLKAKIDSLDIKY